MIPTEAVGKVPAGVRSLGEKLIAQEESVIALCNAVNYVPYDLSDLSSGTNLLIVY